MSRPETPRVCVTQAGDAVYGFYHSDCSTEILCKRDVEYMCCAVHNGDLTLQLLAWGDANPVFNAFLIIASIINIYLAFLIYRNKSLNAHPMKLFSYIAASDSIYLSNQFFYQETCKLGLPHLRSWTVYWAPATYSNLNKALYMTATTFLWVEYFAFYWTAILTVYLIFDLLLVIKRPFADKAKYMRIYELSSPVLAALFATWLYVDSGSNKSNNRAFGVFLVLYILIVMVGVYSSVTALRVLSKSGISKTIRGLVLKRHVSLIALYCVSNMYIAVESYYGLTG